MLPIVNRIKVITSGSALHSGMDHMLYILNPMLSLFEGQCLGTGMTAINITLGAIDAVIALLAFLQLLRLSLRNHNLGCTRQKVFHCLIGSSNLGYLAYFALTPVAKCCGWTCWSHACGFLVMALPQIVFLATFLLLLSFWLDLCHQATDTVEDEEEEDEHESVVLPAVGHHKDAGRRCCSCPRIRSRQKFVIAVVVLISFIAATFAGLIWIGMGDDNSINSSALAQIYSDVFAVVMMISGGGLAGYGLALFHKMRRVRSESTSRDIKKIAELAVVSVVCFSLRAILVLFTDIPVLDIWRTQHVYRSDSPVLLFLYYFIGDSIPSLVVLWVMRDLPVRSFETGNPRLLITDTGVMPDDSLIQHWMDATGETSAGVFTNTRFFSPTAQLDTKKGGYLLY